MFPNYKDIINESKNEPWPWLCLYKYLIGISYHFEHKWSIATYDICMKIEIINFEEFKFVLRVCVKKLKFKLQYQHIPNNYFKMVTFISANFCFQTITTERFFKQSEICYLRWYYNYSIIKFEFVDPFNYFEMVIFNNSRSS